MSYEFREVICPYCEHRFKKEYKIIKKMYLKTGPGSSQT